MINYELFKHINDEHDLILVESQLQDIIAIVINNYMHDMPENVPLYKDSGSWQERNDDDFDQGEVISQKSNESNYVFFENIKRRHEYKI
jgi:hypothetical protein